MNKDLKRYLKMESFMPYTSISISIIIFLFFFPQLLFDSIKGIAVGSILSVFIVIIILPLLIYFCIIQARLMKIMWLPFDYRKRMNGMIIFMVSLDIVIVFLILWMKFNHPSTIAIPVISIILFPYNILALIQIVMFRKRKKTLLRSFNVKKQRIVELMEHIQKENAIVFSRKRRWFLYIATRYESKDLNIEIKRQSPQTFVNIYPFIKENEEIIISICTQIDNAIANLKE